MKKITEVVVGAFLNGERKSLNNTMTDGKNLWLFGNLIARKVDGKLEISNAGWSSNTTKERLNALPNVSIQQKNFQWFLNGKQWNGEWIAV